MASLSLQLGSCRHAAATALTPAGQQQLFDAGFAGAWSLLLLHQESSQLAGVLAAYTWGFSIEV